MKPSQHTRSGGHMVRLPAGDSLAAVGAYCNLHDAMSSDGVPLPMPMPLPMPVPMPMAMAVLVVMVVQRDGRAGVIAFRQHPAPLCAVSMPVRMPVPPPGPAVCSSTRCPRRRPQGLARCHGLTHAACGVSHVTLTGRNSSAVAARIALTKRWPGPPRCLGTLQRRC